MAIEWKIKPFEFQLTVYNLLKLRSEIFVVEQNCVYLDLDGKDKLALHLLQSLKESSSACPTY
jgi:ElaA protein